MSIDQNECSFFHVIDLPGETTAGQWDFRETESAYHGGYDLRGKTVLEIGSATGCHAFWMEREGALVTPYDLSPAYSWDLLTTFRQDPEKITEAMKTGIKQLNNGWTYCRDRLGSRLNLSHGTIYDIPKELGSFDVVTFGSILLHTRDPLGAVQRVADRAKEAIIITDRFAPALDNSKPLMQFMPTLEMAKDWGGWTWWWMSPKVFENLLAILGFVDFEVKVSQHLFVPTGRKLDLFTLIARR